MKDIAVHDLVKRYKELVAVNHISLDVEQGEVFGLLGPNGSGKTTLIHCLLGLLKYDHGSVEIFGKKMDGDASIKRQIGLVPQEVAVYDELTVLENVSYFCGLYIADNRKRKEYVDWALDFVQLNDFRKFRPKKLSGGLLRRLNLACGIAHKPKLIFFDEPTVAVDPQSRNRILEGIKTLNEQGATVVYTSHYMEEVQMLCNRLAILDRGTVLVEGSSEEIINMSSVGETVEMVSYDLTDAAVAKLNDLSDVMLAEYANGKLRLQLNKEGGGLLSILHFLENQGVTPLSVSAEKPRLNDVFLEITGKEFRDHA